MSRLIRKIISTANAPKPVGPYNQAVQVGDTLYVSGVLGIDISTAKLVQGGASNEANQALKNLGQILSAAGSSYSNVVKSTIFLDDINDFSAVNDRYKEYDIQSVLFFCYKIDFKEPFPARSTFQVGKLPMNAKVEIEVVAIVGELVNNL